MTTEEALKYFKRRKEQIGLHDKVQQAENRAIEALKKQIPKKPIGKIDPVFGDSCTVCPNCENTAIVNLLTHSMFNHCPNCGQALDWGDTK